MYTMKASFNLFASSSEESDLYLDSSLFQLIDAFTIYQWIRIKHGDGYPLTPAAIIELTHGGVLPTCTGVRDSHTG